MAAVLTALLLCLIPGAPAHAATAKPQLRVMPLGDSITWGVGSPSTSSYRAPLYRLVSAQAPYTVQFVGSQGSGTLPDQANEGHSGWVISQLRDEIDAYMAATPTDVVLLHIGINDLDRNVDIANAPARFTGLVDRIFANRPGVSVIALGLIPTTSGLEAKVATFNAAVKKVQAKEQAAGHKFLYLHPPALTSAQFADRLHPNDAGYQSMANSFYAGLDEAVEAGWATGSRSPEAGNESGTTGKVRWGDFDGDGMTDYLTVASNGRVDAYLNRGGDGRGGWSPLGQVATGQTSDATRVRFADFDGDGRADYLLTGASGAVSVWLNRGGDGRGGWSPLGQVATGQTGRADTVRWTDLDGDRRADYVWIGSDGGVSAYLNRGGDGRGGWLGRGHVASGMTSDPSRVSFADFDADGNADYVFGDNTTNSATVYTWQGGDGHGNWGNLGTVASGVSIG
ncbi:FG-GAP-like repeat-containing protein [Streptomyces sp. NPDC088747]|uniref:FG-GAP-like repeat-containing protein n=1 Tax=Streptomyces sp. NPDC088747 TaxID=3365886 RepID=UPI0038053EFC